MTRIDTERSLSRRSLLRAAGAASGAAVAIGAGAGLASAAPTGGAASGGGSHAAFGHPGLLHTDADFQRIRTKLAAQAQPYEAGWKVLTANGRSSAAWKPRPLPVVYRGAGSPQNYAQLYIDIAAAYQNALRWRISGETAHGDAARDILNAWSSTLTKVEGSADRFLAAGIYGYQFANAAELMRGYPGFDLARFQHMMAGVFAPVSESFLTDHNGAYVTNYWPNWDLVNMACVLATGILCDDSAQVQRAVDYFKNGAGNGSIRNAIPVVYPDGLGEWLEAGRDQGHTLLGIGMMGAFCQMAWNQGIDLFGYDDNRFLKGAEYVAKWNLGQSVPFTPDVFKKGAPGVWSGKQSVTAASTSGRGMLRPVWALVANHYVQCKGLSAPYVTQMAAKSAPEGGGGDYGPNSGGYDQLGFGTLMYTRDRGTGTAGEAHQSGATTPGGSPSASGTPSAPTSPGTTTRPGAAARGSDLASTGGGETSLYLGAAGLAAVAGGLLLRRGRRRSG